MMEAWRESTVKSTSSDPVAPDPIAPKSVAPEPVASDPVASFPEYISPDAAFIDIPNERVLRHAAKIAMEQDKPLMFDYYIDTRSGGTAFLGEEKDTKERLLVKNPEEYTSPVEKIFKIRDDYIIITQNSIYIVSGALKKKEIRM